MDAPSGSDASCGLSGALFRAPENPISYRRTVRPTDMIPESEVCAPGSAAPRTNSRP